MKSCTAFPRAARATSASAARSLCARLRRRSSSAAGRWGTPQPIIVRNPGMGLGVALMQGYGTFSMQVSDAQQFVTQIVGATGVYRTSHIQARLRSMLLSILQDLL